MKQIVWLLQDVGDWLKERCKRIWWVFSGWWLDKRLAADTEVRGEAEKAVQRVVMETDIAPDCVSACELRGGPCILVKHERYGKPTTEAIIHKTYAQAAEEAIKYILSQQPKTGSRSQLNRAQRRKFDAERESNKRRKRERKETKFLN